MNSSKFEFSDFITNICIYVVKKIDNVPSRLLPIHQWPHVHHVPKYISYHEAIDGLVTDTAHLKI